MMRVLYILLILILLIIPLPVEGLGRVGHSWWNFMHVPVFAIFAYLVISSRVVSGQRWRRSLCMLCMFLLVSAVEFIQLTTGREAAISDMLYGWVGCFAGFLLAGSCCSSSSLVFIRRLAAVLIIGLSAALPVAITIDHVRVRRNFPVLSNFHNPLELTRWDLRGCSAQGGNEGFITINSNEKYPGLFLKDPARDWSGAETLCVDLALLGNEALQMWIRIDDLPKNLDYYNRFQTLVQLNPGPNRIRISRSEFTATSGGRPMDMRNIETMGLFFGPQSGGHTVNLERIYLELGEL